MKIAVAGASGRLGQSFVRKLVENNYDAVALLRSKSSMGKIPKGVSHRFVDYNSNTSDLKKTLEDISHIVNITGTSSTYLPESELEKANVGATKKLLEAAPSSLQKFIHISSVSVYGKHHDGIRDENSPKNADSAYAKTKLAGERVALSYKKNFSVIIIQPGMIYGPGFVGGFYPILRKILEGKMKLIGDGTNHIPLVHVDDVSNAILGALSAKVESGSTYLIVSEPQVTQTQLIDMAASSLGVSPPNEHADYNTMRILVGLKVFYDQLRGKKPSITMDMVDQLYCDRRFSSKKAAMELRFKPSISFKMGIEQVVNQFLRENNAR